MPFIEGDEENGMKISDIKIGDRSRKDLGDISSLAKSIESVGLLHPIVVCKDGTLIAGARRIAAYVALGRDEIPHTTVKSIDEALKFLLAERDENIERKDFIPSEAHAMAKRLEPFEREAAKERQAKAGPSDGKGAKASASEKFSTPVGRASDKVASAVGLSRPTLRKIEAVIQAAEENPEKYKPVAEEMDRTGKVDRAAKQVVRMKALEGGPIPAEEAKHEPGWRWSKAFHDLYKFMNSTRDAGGIAGLVFKWSVKQRTAYIEEIKSIIGVLESWISYLEGKEANGQPG
jgi:ParB-like chromosome segregation protein Spo0J